MNQILNGCCEVLQTPIQNPSDGDMITLNRSELSRTGFNVELIDSGNLLSKKNIKHLLVIWGMIQWIDSEPNLVRSPSEVLHLFIINDSTHFCQVLWLASPEQVETIVLWAVLQGDIDPAEGDVELASQSLMNSLPSGLLADLLQLQQQSSSLRTLWVQRQSWLHVMITAGHLGKRDDGKSCTFIKIYLTCLCSRTITYLPVCDRLDMLFMSLSANKTWQFLTWPSLFFTFL